MTVSVYPLAPELLSIFAATLAAILVVVPALVCSAAPPDLVRPRSGNPLLWRPAEARQLLTENDGVEPVRMVEFILSAAP